MTFFRDFPVPNLPPRPKVPKPIRPEWSGAPDDELPAVVHLGKFLHRSSNRVLAVRSAQVFSTGCTLDVSWFIRRADESDQDWAALNAAFLATDIPRGTRQVAVACYSAWSFLTERRPVRL